MARFDAASYFKNCDVTRVSNSAFTLLANENQRTGLDAVSFNADAKSVKWVLDPGNSKSQKLLRLDEIRDAVTYGVADKFFVLGDTVLERNRGLPMGGSLSEPLLLIDAGWHVNTFLSNPVPCDFMPGFPGHLDPCRIVAGFMHVDDLLLHSGTLCATCLQTLVRRIFPAYFGFCLEET